LVDKEMVGWPSVEKPTLKVQWCTMVELGIDHRFFFCYKTNINQPYWGAGNGKNPIGSRCGLLFVFFPAELRRDSSAQIMLQSYSRTPGTDGSGYTNLNVYYMNPWLQIVLWGNTSNMNFEFVGKVAWNWHFKTLQICKGPKKERMVCFFKCPRSTCSWNLETCNVFCRHKPQHVISLFGNVVSFCSLGSEAHWCDIYSAEDKKVPSRIAVGPCSS
jgi:hypothetical protein